MQRFGAVWSLIEEMKKENSHLIDPELFAVLAAEGVEITYVSAIKLMHEKTKFHLHSHDMPYGSGSDQQSVTGFPGVVDSTATGCIYTGRLKPFPLEVSTCVDSVCAHDSCRPAIDFIVELMYASSILQAPELVSSFQRRLCNFVEK
ncbi:putative pentatricopeptide repeat-containing protein [Raphanus sativus]|nr:putative pentatricopeptide repeat-containing protein [Raphanus sativus]